MDQNQEIINQLTKLNKKLDTLIHPAKSAWRSFYLGIFRALGYLFGTAVVASIIIYILSQSGFGQNISNWIQSNQFSNYQISVPVPDQP